MSASDVSVVEVGPRDGLQNEPGLVPTPAKVRLVDLLSAAGLPVIEVSSFVRGDLVPQLADAEQVLAAITRRPGVRYPVLVPNMRGLDRAAAAGADALAVFTAASDGFARANIRMSVEESLVAFRPVVEAARERGMWVRGYVSTAFGCPYEGRVEPAAVVAVATALAEAGCQQLSIGDTIGVADPAGVRRVVAALVAELPVATLALHLHDTAGRAVENAAAGLELGVRTFDGSAAGLGGCPFAPGAPGNVATERLVEWLEGQGLRTGVDGDALRAAADYARAAVSSPRPTP